jgi:hypothetical protein
LSDGLRRRMAWVGWRLNPEGVVLQEVIKCM